MPRWLPRQTAKAAAEKDAIKGGKSAAEIWPERPAEAAQKDIDACSTLKVGKARLLLNGKPGIDIVISTFGYKCSIAICRRFSFMRRGKVTDSAHFDGRMLRDVVTSDNTASDAQADWVSQSNQPGLAEVNRPVSRVHRKKPMRKPVATRIAYANAAKSTVRARIEHVFARQKDQVELFIRTISEPASSLVRNELSGG